MRTLPASLDHCMTHPPPPLPIHAVRVRAHPHGHVIKNNAEIGSGAAAAFGFDLVRTVRLVAAVKLCIEALLFSPQEKGLVTLHVVVDGRGVHDQNESPCYHCSPCVAPGDLSGVRIDIRHQVG